MWKFNHIIHLTSAHPRYDIRIFHKECKSLSKKYKVSLIVADGKGDEVRDDISIYDVGKPLRRKERMLQTPKKLLIKALTLNGKIYHLHDPELIPIGIKLKKAGKKVIFDSHEDVPKQILEKHYLNIFVKKFLSFFYSQYEIFMLKKFDFIIGATPFIRDKFLKKGISSIDINNFPLLNELLHIKPEFKDKNICYIGLLYKTRGLIEIIKAIENLNVTLIIAGKFFDKDFEKEIKSLKGWRKVDFRGFVGRNEIMDILKKSIAGLVTLYPTESYKTAYPVKMFEYMAAGIPVIASDFPVYKNFIEKNLCGLCVNPLNIEDIACAINELLKNLEKARKMGENGKQVVKEKYNWEIEESKLLDLYEKLTYD